MIDFAAIKGEIASFVPALTGLPAAAVRWRDEAQGSTWAQGPSLWMRLQTVTRMGIEEEFRTAGAAPGDDEVVTLSGQREFVWNVRAESFEQDIASPDFAGNILDRLCLRLMRSTAIFARTSFGIVHRWPTQFFSYKESGRQVSCFVVDIVCATKDTDIDTTRGAGNYIDSVHVLGDINGERQVDEIITSGDT